MNGKLKSLFAGAVAFAGLAAGAAPTVTIDRVACAEPWTTVEVNYTASGLDAGLKYAAVFTITAQGETASLTNEAVTASVLEGQPKTQTIDTAALFGEAKADPHAKAKVALIAIKPSTGGVQLWAGGPYWAECNVGATNPEESGYYFWWGDAVGYKRNAANDGWVSAKDGTTTIEFSWDDATAGQTDGKDNATLQSEGWIDASDNLTMAHDAARAHLGGTWRMPTADEIQALVRNTKTKWVDDYQGTGVKGRLFTGKDDYARKSIFIPAAGYGEGAFFYDFGWCGCCWSSTPGSDNSNAQYLNFYSGGVFVEGFDDHYLGRAVRPVRDFAE